MIMLIMLIVMFNAMVGIAVIAVLNIMNIDMITILGWVLVDIIRMILVKGVIMSHDFGQLINASLNIH
jgi:hypothetical protein